MPEFEESTGYKMKGSAFYGKGNSSPAKVSDDKVVEAQAKLDVIQDGWKEPGWSKAAKKVFSPGIGGGGKGGGGKGGTPEAKATPNNTEKSANVQENASKKMLSEDYKLGDLGSNTSMEVQ